MSNHKIFYKIFAILFLQFLVLNNSQAQNLTTQTDIVCFDGKLSVFPDEWLDKKTRARATACDTIKFKTDLSAIQKAFSKYPKNFIDNEVKHIYIMGKISFNKEWFTGTNSRYDIFIASTDNDEIEKTFHHEFSSILLRNHPNFTMEINWKALSPELIGGNSAFAIEQGYNDVTFNKKLCEKGYLSKYSLSNWENDFNMYAENIFTGGKEFWKIVDAYPKVKIKTNMVIAYYAKLNAVLSEDYFRALAE
jgi:hypothetical protein